MVGDGCRDIDSVNYIVNNSTLLVLCVGLQAGLIGAEAKMPEQGESEELEKLRLEHFYLAFFILGGGLAISLVILMGEMCSSKFCCKNETS